MQFVILVALLFGNCYCGNILFVSLQSTPSAHIWNEALVEALLANGHKITLLGHSETKLHHENYTVLTIPGVREVTGKAFDATTTTKYSAIDNIIWQWKGILATCKHDFKSEALRKLMKYPRYSFDLIIIDINNGQCYYPLVDYFGSPPTISVSPFGIAPFLGEIIGHHSFGYHPFYSLQYSDRMNFWERLHNIVSLTADRFFRWYYMKAANKLAKDYFGRNTRELEDIENNITLLLTNNDPILDYPQPYPPNVIPVGGMHIKPPKPLDKKLQRIFDDSDGVIYFSMGTNILSDNIDSMAKNAFIEAFSKINQTVLWKMDSSSLNVSRNVIINKWYPQGDILAQPKLKLFITHCGRLGGHEAMNYGVPIVGVPIALDTPSVCTKIKTAGGGVQLNFLTLTPQVILNAITQVLQNPEYKQNMMKISRLYRSQPQTAIERAVMWTEYVLKTGHASHYSPATRFMKWYEIENLDVLLVCIILLGIAMYVLLLALRFLGTIVDLFFIESINYRKQKEQ